MHFIPNILADFDIFQHDRNFRERLSNFRQKLTINRRKYQTNCTEADVFKERAKRDLKRQRKMLNNFFDKLERQTENEIDQIRDEDGKKMEEISKQYDQLESEFNNMHVSGELKKDELGKMCQMLVYMKLTEDTFKDLEDKMAKLSEENKIRKYELFISEEILTLIEKRKSFAVLSTKCAGWKRRVEFCGKMNIKAASDGKHWNIKGICMLNANLLVAADLRNECLKLIEMRKTSSKSGNVEIKLSSWPWDVTKVTDDQAAVTLPAVGLVCFLSAVSMSNESLAYRKFKISTIHVGHECRGIKCSKGKLIITFSTDPGMIKIFNLEGVALQRFSTWHDGEELFISPHYLTLGQDDRTIYVSDYQKNSVISLGMDGVVKDIIKNDDLRSPGGLVVDRAGSVFVCGSRFYNVHQLDSDLSYIQLLLDHSNAQERPQCIAYCPETNMIFVGMEYKSYINMFRLL